MTLVPPFSRTSCLRVTSLSEPGLILQCAAFPSCLACLSQEHLQSIERRLLQLQREARRQSKDQELCGVTPRSQLVCLAIYILSGFNMAAAEAFIHDARARRKRRLTEEVLAADIPSMVRQWFRDFPLERLYALQQPDEDSIPDQGVHAEASKYIAKFETAAWVADQNYERGVAPTYDALVFKYNEELQKRDLGHLSERLRWSAEGGDGRPGVAGRAARAWCGRFCKQFAFSRRRLGVGSEMPPTELEEKAWI